MLQEWLYIPFKWALFLSFADVMCFFISVYLLIRVSEKCQNILFLLLKRRERLDFHRYGIPSNFSFPKLSFIESHTIISEVCFNNKEFHSLIFGVILGVILCFLCHFLNLEYHSLSFGCHFRSHFDCHFGCHSEFSVHLFCLLYCVSIHDIQKFEYRFIVLGFTLGFGVHIIVLPFYSMKNGKCEIITLFYLDYVKMRGKNEWDNVKYLRIYDSDYVKSVIFAVVIKDIRYG